MEFAFFLQQSSMSSVLFWGQENQQMLLTVGLCVLTTAFLVSAGIILFLRSRHLARQKLKEFTQSADAEATRDYQVGKFAFYFESAMCGIKV
jgi:hypothetical protein